MERKPISTVELKALYDFSLINNELKTHTGTVSERKSSEHYRDVLYAELLKRLAHDTIYLE